MGIVIFLGILFLIVTLLSKSKNNNNILQKIILSIIYFVIFFMFYSFTIAIGSTILLYFISGNSGAGTDSGLWAYGLILGMTLAPILSIITTVKLINNKTKNINRKNKESSMKDKITLLCPLWLIEDGEFNDFEVGEYYSFNAMSYELLPYKDKQQDDPNLKYDYYIEPYCDKNYLICGVIKKIWIIKKGLTYKECKSLNECVDEEGFNFSDLLIEMENCDYIEMDKQKQKNKKLMDLNTIIADAFNPFSKQLTKELRKNNLQLTICHPDQKKLYKFKKEFMQTKGFSKLTDLNFDMTKKEDVYECFQCEFRDIFITTNKDNNYQKTKEYILQNISEHRKIYFDINSNKKYTKITCYKTIFGLQKNWKYDFITKIHNYYFFSNKPKKIAKRIISLIKKHG